MDFHLFLDTTSDVSLEIVEMQMQFAMDHVAQLLGVPVGQGNSRVVEKVNWMQKRNSELFV
jgi:hypothetical protein